MTNRLVHYFTGNKGVKLLAFFIFSLIIFHADNLYAQKQIKDYVIGKSVPITNIEPDSTNFSDLEVIGNAIGNAKVVMLGEQDHGDAPTFLAKTRLIKYLHEKKGFNVLAFESDFFGLNDGWDKLKKEKPGIDTFILKNVFGIWTLCNTCNNLLFNYLPATYKTNTPLVLTGFDSQQYLNYSFHHLKDRLDSLFRNLKIPITQQANYTTEILPSIDSPKRWIFFPPKDSVRVNKCLHNLLLMRSQMAPVLHADDFWLLVVDNLVQQATVVKIQLITGKIADDERDVQMAKNLKWLIENKFKDQKIIVWAASRHTAKGLNNMKYDYFKNVKSMGEELMETIDKKDNVYILGFTSYQGTAGRIGTKPYSVESRKNGFEGWLNPLYKYAFVNFTKYNQLYPGADEDFFMSGFGHRNYSGKWYHIFDGMFFIRDMYPCVATR